MQNTKNTVFIVLSDSGVSHEVSEEFSIPDYMPEVRRIISCNSSVIPDGKFTDGHEVTLSGIVAYSVIYVGDDGDVTTAPLNTDYTVRIPLNSDGPSTPSDQIPVMTCVSSVNCRATAPRRLRITSRLFSKLLVTSESSAAETVCAKSSPADGKSTPTDSVSIERHTTDVTSASLLCHTSQGSASGTFNTKAGTKIISCEAHPAVTEVRCDSSYAAVKGEVNLKCLVLTDGEGYSTVNMKAPLDEHFTLSPAGGGKRFCSAVMRCTALDVRGSDEGNFTWTFEYDTDLYECTERITAVTDDVYSTAFESSTESMTLPVMQCLKNTVSRLSVSGKTEIQKGDSDILCSSARVVTDRSEYSANGHLTVSGSCTVRCALSTGDRIDVHDVVIPVKLELDCKGSDGKPEVLCDAQVLDYEVTSNEDRLNATAELIFTVIAYEKRPVAFISNCTVDRESPVDTTGEHIRIYYPTPDETQWNIGKKYHIPQNSITPIPGTPAVMLRRSV